MFAGFGGQPRRVPAGLVSRPGQLGLRFGLVGMLFAGHAMAQMSTQPAQEDFWFGSGRVWYSGRNDVGGVFSSYFATATPSLFGILQGGGEGLAGVPAEQFFRFAYGQSTGSNPVSGSARWNGIMFGSEIEEGALAATGTLLMGNATVSISNFLNPRVSVAFVDIAELESGTARDDISWAGAVPTDGMFRVARSETDWVDGQFYGAGHKNVGGEFQAGRIFGSYGATREAAAGAPVVEASPSDFLLDPDILTQSLGRLVVDGAPKMMGFLGLGLEVSGVPDFLHQVIASGDLLQPGQGGPNRITSTLRATFPHNGIGYGTTTSRTVTFGSTLSVDSTTDGYVLLGTHSTSVFSGTDATLEIGGTLAGLLPESILSQVPRELELATITSLGRTMPGALPTTGSARWTGVMYGHAVTLLGTDGNRVAGDAEIMIEDLATPEATVAFTNIVDLVTDRSRSDIVWTRIPVVQHTFRSREGDDWLDGMFSGPNHEEVQGFFERSGTVGSFGAVRASAGQASGVEDGLPVSLRIRSTFTGLNFSAAQLAGLLGIDLSSLGALVPGLPTAPPSPGTPAPPTPSVPAVPVDPAGPLTVDLTNTTVRSLLLSTLSSAVGFTVPFSSVEAQLTAAGVSDLTAVPVADLQRVADGFGLSVNVEAALEGLLQLTGDGTGTGSGDITDLITDISTGEGSSLVNVVQGLLGGDGDLEGLLSGRSLAQGTEALIRNRIDNLVIDNGVTITEALAGSTRTFYPRGNVTVRKTHAQISLPDETLDLNVFGAWLSQGFFGVVELATPVGEPGGASVAAAMVRGAAPGTNPVSGSGRWSGTMLGIDLGENDGTRGSAVWGDADIVINDFQNPAVDVTFYNIADMATQTPRADMEWSGIPVASGAFEAEDADSRIEGEFFGAGHEEVGGLFERDNITGSFGARSVAP